jgi:hypothetical protein
MQRHGQMRIHDTDTDTDQKEGRKAGQEGKGNRTCPSHPETCTSQGHE